MGVLFIVLCLFQLCVYSDKHQNFAQFLRRTFKSTDSIRNYIVGIKTMHLLLGYSVDNINKFILNLSLKGIAKLHPYCRKQAEPITPEILISIADSLNLSVTNNLVYWCLFLFAFFLMARKSNLVPTTGKDLLEKKFFIETRHFRQGRSFNC